jgi:hypothetical protein
MQNEWKQYLNFDNYLFSNYGVIKNKKTNKIINGYICDGFLRTNLRDNTNKKIQLAIHNVIAYLFVENKYNYKFVKHKDDNKINNVYTNLEYISTCKKINYGNIIENEKWEEIVFNKSYEISDKGRVRNKLSKSLISQRCYDGYLSCSVGENKRCLIHLLVANAFIPKEEGKNSVDHIDKNRLNNNMLNLRWATNKEQCENRSWSKGDILRKIQRIDIDTKNLLETYNNINDAVKYIFDNNLCKETTNAKSINITLWNASRKNEIRYGYLWKYETNEEVCENEVWKSVKEVYPDANDYKVSNLGRVKNPNDIFINGTKSGDYTSIYIGIKGRKKIHILVAKLFIPNPENKRCVNHIDGDKTNNCLSNLEWNTHSENVNHAMDNNLNPCCKKIKIIDLNSNIETIYPHITKASKELKISRNTIMRYINKKEPYNDILFELI